MSKYKTALARLTDAHQAEQTGLYGFASLAYEDAAWMFRDAQYEKNAPEIEVLKRGFDVASEDAARTALWLTEPPMHARMPRSSRLPVKIYQHAA